MRFCDSDLAAKERKDRKKWGKQTKNEKGMIGSSSQNFVFSAFLCGN
jgi:hypothetical protein